VVTDPWFAATPFQIEIVNQAEWWQPYVPPGLGLLGSIVVASAAFYGIRRSHLTNQETNAAADNRESAKWRRETILRLCAELQIRASEVEDICVAGVKARAGGEAFDFSSARDRCRQMLPLAYQFGYVNFPEGSAQCSTVYRAGMKLVVRSEALSDALDHHIKRFQSGLYTKPLASDQVEELEEQIAIFEEPHKAALREFNDAQADFAYRATFEFHADSITPAQITQAMADMQERRRAEREDCPESSG